MRLLRWHVARKTSTPKIYETFVNKTIINTMNIDLLTEFLVECISEAMARRRAGTSWKGQWHDPDDKSEDRGTEERHKHTTDVQTWRTKGDAMFEREVDDLRSEPEYADLKSFIKFKIDDEDLKYSAADLQALARNVDFLKRYLRDALPSATLVDSVKKELEKAGLKFEPRQPQKHFRGSMSSMAGASRYTGNYGGSGFGIEGFTSYGRGPGAIGGKTEYSANDPRSLPMGSTRK